MALWFGIWVSLRVCKNLKFRVRVWRIRGLWLVQRHATCRQTIRNVGFGCIEVLGCQCTGVCLGAPENSTLMVLKGLCREFESYP